MSQTLPTVIPIEEIIEEAEEIRTFVFEHKLNAMPGQFVMVWLPQIDEKPFSVWTTDPNKFYITVSAVGPFSKKLSELKVGDKIGFRGPFGKGFTIPKKGRIALIGGGFGTAPLLFLASEIKKHTEYDGEIPALSEVEVDLIIGARSKNLLFGKEHAEKLGISVLITTNDGTCGEKCFNTQLFEKLLENKKIEMVYTCGPELMMEVVAKLCAKHSIPCELSLERYMKCGFGVCGACAIDDSGFRACKDGPVISGEKALQLSEFGKYHRDSVGVRKKL